MFAAAIASSTVRWSDVSDIVKRCSHRDACRSGDTFTMVHQYGESPRVVKPNSGTGDEERIPWLTEAVEKVLNQFGSKEPMHYREITGKALEQGWLDTEGRTPEATMGAQLYTAVKRAQRRGGGLHPWGKGKDAGRRRSFAADRIGRLLRHGMPGCYWRWPRRSARCDGARPRNGRTAHCFGG